MTINIFTKQNQPSQESNHVVSLIALVRVVVSDFLLTNFRLQRPEPYGRYAEHCPGATGARLAK